MKKDEFLTLLYNEMIRLGATPETAEHHTRAINDAFSHEDIARVERIKHPEEVSNLAQAIVGAKAKAAPPQPDPTAEEDTKISSAEEAVPEDTAIEEEPVEEIIDDDDMNLEEEFSDDDSDMKVYAGGAAVTSLPVPDSIDEDALYEEICSETE